ncbi:hypothetical protein ACFSNO_27390 [Streptomyces cirratus]
MTRNVAASSYSVDCIVTRPDPGPDDGPVLGAGAVALGWKFVTTGLPDPLVRERAMAAPRAAAGTSTSSPSAAAPCGSALDAGWPTH